MGMKMCTVQFPKMTNMIFNNPCLDLQQYLDVPILKKEDNCWNPSMEAMKFSLDLFLPKKHHNIEKICNVVDPNKFPSHDMPEVALLGRSNSGKSTLLKAIFHENPKLKIQTSKKPGHTKSLKFYKIAEKLCVVDMPGYGLQQPKWFESSVVHYLKHRKNLVKTFLLIDCRASYHDWDDALLQMMQDIKIPFVIVLTKIDAVKDSQRLKTFLYLRNIINEFQANSCFPQIFMLSAQTLEGLGYFVSFIAHCSGNLNNQIS